MKQPSQVLLAWASLASALMCAVSLQAQPLIPVGQWDFENGDLGATTGDALDYIGDTGSRTTFGTTTSLGLPDINGQAATVMCYPANTNAQQGFNLYFFATPNGGGSLVNQWTIIFDILFPAESDGKWRALLETRRSLTEDAELFVNPSGGLGVSGQFHGQILPNTWYRIGLVVDASTNVLRKYINGTLVGTQSAASGATPALDGRWALDTSIGTMELFNDDNGEAAPGYVNSIQLREEALTTGQMQALGGPSAAGIPQTIPPVPSFVERWIPATARANRDTDLGVIIDTGDTTIEDSSISLSLNGQALTDLQITRDGSLISVLKTDGAPLPVPSDNVLQVSYTDSAAGQKAFSNSFSAVVFFEDFESLTLGPNVEESLAGAEVWTKTAPPGWMIDDSGVPGAGTDNDGVREWAGWSFANRVWWATAADDQTRSTFTKGIGTVAVADPDEWDDSGHDPGMYNTFMVTAPIALQGLEPNSATLSFDSSWRPECCDDNAELDNSQTATVEVSYDGGPFIEILKWDSTPASSFYHADNQNESVLLDLDNPAGASSMVLKFGLSRAENDWWWAVDNLFVQAGVVVPAINIQPAPQLVSAGGTATFTVVASGTEPLTYRWQFNGNDVTGVNNATFSLPNAQVANAGNYRVIISNAGGAITSQVARLEIFDGAITQDLVAHLKLDGDFSDSSGRNNDATAVNNPTFSAGQVGPNAIHIPSGQDYVTLGAPPDLNFGLDVDFSISFWAKVVALSGDPAFISNKDWGSGGNPGYVLSTQADGHMEWNIAGPPGPRRDYDGPPGVFSDGQWHHVVVVFDRDGEAVTYIDGTRRNGTDLSGEPNQVDTPVGFNTNIGQDGTGFYGPAFSDADLDDVGVWRRRLTGQEVTNIYSQGLLGFDLSTANSEPLRIASVTASGSDVVITWASGTGPFVVEKKSALTDADWMEVATTPDRTATLPRSGLSGFFRIRGNQ